MLLFILALFPDSTETGLLLPLSQRVCLFLPFGDQNSGSVEYIDRFLSLNTG